VSSELTNDTKARIEPNTHIATLVYRANKLSFKYKTTLFDKKEKHYIQGKEAIELTKVLEWIGSVLNLS
jgi:predicted DsbA family dithiol-disulfide isomerase